jgi:arylsulfatase A-like enzyme
VKRATSLAASFGLLAALGLLGCRGDEARAPLGFEGAPVLLVTIDTVRADHLSLYDYERPTSPYLVDLARRSVVFDHALAQSPWTLPSMLSLFSSLEPPALGIRDGVRPATRRGDEPRGAGEHEIEYFADEHRMLPEVLREAGYATDGVSTNGHLIRRQGFAQGFAEFDETACMWGDARCALDRAFAILERAPRRRHFLWVHLFDPHFDRAGAPPEYDPPPAVEGLFTGDGGTETVRDYDRKLRWVDDSLRAFFSELATVRDVDELLVVIAADHGEEFFEKGRWGHSKAVTNSLVHVPLLFRLPGGVEGGRRVGSPVRLLDVAPTIVELLELAPVPSFHGTSLVPALRGSAPRVAAAYGETRRSGRSIHYWVDVERDRKLVLDRTRGRRDLYHFSGDPAEERDLSAAEPELVGELEGRVSALLEALDLEPGAVPETLDEATRERMRALGYL